MKNPFRISSRRSWRTQATLTPEETAYYGALVDYAKECRPLLNQGQYQLPEPPKLSDFDQSLQDYKAQVQAEIEPRQHQSRSLPRSNRRKPKSSHSGKPRNRRQKSLRHPTTTIPSTRARPAEQRK